MNQTETLRQIKVEPSEIDLKQPLGRFLIILFRQFEDELIKELKTLGHRAISPSDLNVIRHVNPKGTSSARIAQLAGVSKQAIAKQVDKLEKSGIIRRDHHPQDHRTQLIVFTEKGQKLVTDCVGIIQKIESRHAKLLGGKNELEKIKRALQSLFR